MGSTAPANVTFRVDMNDYTGTFTTAYVSGSMNGWSGDANPMTDANGDGIWETTLMVGAGDYEFKFTLDNWTADEQFTKGDPCTVSINGGEFVNRFISVAGDMTICFLWNTCDACEPLATNDITIDNSFFQLQPNLVDQSTKISFTQPSFSDRILKVFNATGALIFEQKIESGMTEYNLNTGHFQKGIYFVNVLEGDVLGTQKMLKL
jgi:hypothetical protein